MGDNKNWQALRLRRASPDEILRIFNVTHPPVDVRQIAVDMGVRLEAILEPDEADYSGEVELVGEGNKKAFIRFVLGQASVRQRFTIAHEIAHLMLHKLETGKAHRDNTFSGNPKEMEANQFAADLLVPFSMLSQYLRRYKHDVGVLAALFAVSEITMQIRMAKIREWAPRLLGEVL